MRTHFALLAPSLLLAALPLSALPLPALAQTVPVPSAADGTLLEISAEGRTTRVPDVATIRAGVVTQSPTAAAALSANAQRMAAVLAALKKAGVAPRDIATAQVGLQPQYRYADNQPPVVTGYQATNSVSVRFREIARSGAILDTLVAQGANQIDGPSLSLDQPDAALDEARTDAIQRARARADLYAKAAGLHVAKVLSITETGENRGDNPQPPGIVYMRAVAAPAPTQIAAGETNVAVNLSVRFLLQ